MATRGERLREHLGRLTGHFVRGYRKAIGPRPNQQRPPPYQPVPNRRRPNKKAQNIIRVQQLIHAGVLKPFRKSQVDGGRSLKHIMNEKMGNWKIRLGMHNRNLINKYGNLGNIRVLKSIRNNARKAQNSKNTKKKMYNTREYIQKLSVNNLRKILTPNQIQALRNGNPNALALKQEYK